MSKKKLTIGFVFDDSVDRVDGVQQYVQTLGRYFMSQGHEVHYLVGQSDQSKNPDLTIHSLARNVSVRANQNRLSIPLPAKIQPIKQLLSEVEFDVLHVQVPYSPLMSGKVIKRCSPNTKVVGTFHIVGASPLETLGSRALSTVQKRTLDRFDSMVAVSTAAQDFARMTYGIDTEVVPNPVRVDAFQDKKPFTKFNDKQNIVYVNRLVERKGCRHLINAVHELNKQGKFDDRRLIICGKGPLLQNLQAQVAEFGLQDCVSFEGFISEEDKPRYLASADLACYPSTGGESFGIVLIEAMAAGALTLGGDNVGYRTVLGEQAELIVDPQNTDEMAARIDRLLSDDALRKRLLEWQSEAIKNYDVSAVGNRLIDIYQR